MWSNLLDYYIDCGQIGLTPKCQVWLVKAAPFRVRNPLSCVRLLSVRIQKQKVSYACQWGWGVGGEAQWPCPFNWCLHWASCLHWQPALTMFHPRPPSGVRIGPERKPGQRKQPCVQEGPFPNWPGQGGRDRRREGSTANHSFGRTRSVVIILQLPPLFLRSELPQSPVKLALS